MENETVSFEAIIDVDEARKGVSAEGDDVPIGGSMMEVLDGVFMPLMAYCAADSDVPLDAVPQLKIDPLAEASPEMLRAEEVAAAAKFRVLAPTQY